MAKHAKEAGVWGIDLGQCALKAIRLEHHDGEIQATAFDYVEHPKILGQPDADPDQLTREALEKFLSRNDLHGDLVAISVPGQSGLARFVKLPPVDQRKIGDIVKFEAKQQIPFPLHEVVWGFQRLGAGTTNDNMIMDAEIGLFAMKRDMINRALQHFKEVGIEVHFIQMAPLALCNFLAHDLLGKGQAPTESEDEEKSQGKRCVVGLDIGTDNSNLVITDGEKIIWQRPIPLGGNHFTRALTKDLKLTFAKAEHLKRNAMKSPDLKKILTALKPVLNDFVSEVQRSLGYFTNTHRDATIKQMLGLGNAFRLPGLQKYLQEKLQLEVRKLQKIRRLSGDDSVTEAPQYVENVLSFGVAQGLALQGLNQTCIHTNLLPPEIAQERVIKAKKPWAVAAAAALLLLTPPLMLGWAAAKTAWADKGVENANNQLAGVVSAAKKLSSDNETLENEVKESRKAILGLAGGVPDRLNWMHLYHFISEAVPRPDGTYVSKAARTGINPYDKYFADESAARGKGKDALDNWMKLKTKVAKGEALSKQEQESIEQIKGNLVQVHIESVAALFTEDLLKEYFAPIGTVPGAYCMSFKGLREHEKKIMKDQSGYPRPKGGTWVIEVHGYTYHWDRDAFVESTFLENLVDLAEPDPANRRLKNIKLHPETEKALRDKDKKARASYFVLFEAKYEADPSPRNFTLLYHSFMGPNMSIFGQAGASVAPTTVATPGADPTKAADPDPATLDPVASAAQGSRVGWRPAKGTAIFDIFQPQPVGRAQTPGLAVTPTAKTGIEVAGRTEFVIVFLWQEAQSK